MLLIPEVVLTVWWFETDIGQTCMKVNMNVHYYILSEKKLKRVSRLTLDIWWCNKPRLFIKYDSDKKKHKSDFEKKMCSMPYGNLFL